MEETTEARLEELEIRNAYLERTVEELNGRIFEHQKEIDRMETVLKQVTKRISDLAPGNNSLPENERPPHY